jgi:biotin carboxyl carrier protein
VRTYQITVNNREYTVEIDDPNVSPVTVRVNGKPFQVAVNEQVSAVAAPAASDTEALAEEAYVPVVTTTFVDVPTAPEPQAAQAPAPASAPGQGTTQVIAPMPGKIMDIVAKVGDQIKNGDVLCNLEAMKMKSPIRSTASGTVAQVLISEGQNVKYGDILFTLS